MPKGIRNIEFSVDGDGLTQFGGLILFQRFCKSLGLRRFLQRRVHWPSFGRKYHPVDIFLTHLFAMTAGLGRIENARSLSHNGPLPSLLGLQEFTHRDTLRTFLTTATPEFLISLQTAHDLIRMRALKEILPIWSATLDLDTTALRVFGRQMEGGVVGYVPHYSHQRCYNVRLLTEANTGLSLAGELRPGNMLGIVDAIAFVRSGINKSPSRIASSRIRLRADAAFYDGDLVRFLDENSIGYTIVGRATNRLTSAMGKASFHRLVGDWQIGEFKYHPIKWDKPHRFIVARKRTALLELSTTLFTMEDYAYHILLSDLPLSPQPVWRLYNQRMSQELLIRELKNHYAMIKIPSRALLADQMYLEILLWAYDLIHLFKRLCLPSRCHRWSVSTIRRELWLLPAQLVHTQNKNRLKLPPLFPHLGIFTYAYEAAGKIKALG